MFFFLQLFPPSLKGRLQRTTVQEEFISSLEPNLMPGGFTFFAGKMI